MKKVLTLSLFILIFLFSCNDVSDFLFETDQSVEIRTINNGYIYRGGDSLPLSILFDNNITPQSFSVTIFDDEGTSWGKTSIPIPLKENEYNTYLLVPDELPQGKYIFHVRVFENEQELSFREIIIFKTDSDYVIEQLLSMPHETEAGRDVLIKARLSYPEEVDPFLRWSIDGSILKQGFLSDGFDSIHWLSEDENGLYQIKLEVFPESCDSSMISSISAFSEIIVTDDPLAESDSLSPEEEYSLLFHFSGDFLPENSGDFSLAEYGSVEATSINNELVYLFSENNGISVKGSVLPQSDGLVTPFSVNGRISLSESMDEGNLMLIKDKGKNLFSLYFNSRGNLVFSTADFLSVSLFAVTDVTDFSLQVIPLDDTIDIRWFYNGLNGGTDSLPLTFPQVSDIQEVFIGGDNDVTSASMVLDELGIYVGDMKNSRVDGSQFKRIKKYALGENLIDAQGFDDINGDYKISPGEKFPISSFPLTIKDTELVLSFPQVESDEAWTLILENRDGMVLAEIPQDFAFEEIDINTGLVSRKLRLSLKFNEEEDFFELTGNNNLRIKLDIINPGDKLSLFFETNVENKKDYPLDFFIIITNIDSAIPDLLVNVEEEDNLL